jgi:hypothetical protein
MIASREPRRSRKPWIDSARLRASPSISSRPRPVRRDRRQGQDGAGLFVGQAHAIAVHHHGARVGDQLDQRHHLAGRPVAGDQAFARLGRIDRRADDVDGFVDVGDGDGQADQHVAAVARLVQFEPRAPDHHLFAEFDEGRQHLAQAHLQRAAAVQGQHVDAEAALQGGEAVELVEDHVAGRVALQLHDDAEAVAVALVADVGDALDALFAHQVGDVLDQAGLVHLVGDRADDDGVAARAHLLDGRLAAGDHRAAAGQQGVAGPCGP